MIGAENEPWKNQNIVFPAWSCSSASSLAPPDSVSEPWRRMPTGDPPNGGDPPFEEPPPREGDVTSDDWCERADGGRATAADFGARGSSAMMTVSRCCGLEVSVGVVEGSQSLYL